MTRQTYFSSKPRVTVSESSQAQISLTAGDATTNMSARDHGFSGFRNSCQPPNNHRRPPRLRLEHFDLGDSIGDFPINLLFCREGHSLVLDRFFRQYAVQRRLRVGQFSSS
jgi:hypothetical protein